MTKSMHIFKQVINATASIQPESKVICQEHWKMRNQKKDLFRLTVKKSPPPQKKKKKKKRKISLFYVSLGSVFNAEDNRSGCGKPTEVIMDSLEPTAHTGPGPGPGLVQSRGFIATLTASPEINLFVFCNYFIENSFEKEVFNVAIFAKQKFCFWPPVSNG